MSDRTSGASRFYKSAVATSALPLLALGSATAATAAVADASSTALSPKPATPANLTAAQQQLESSLMPTEQLAVALPARFTQQNFQAASTAPKTYKVKSGDTLGHIALKHDVSLSNLLKWNNLTATAKIYPGQKLDLGPSGSSNSVSTASSSSSSSSGGTYKVKAGDTLSAIAARQGISLSTLLKANDLAMSAVIYPGQTLKLSGSAAGSTSSPNSSKKSSSSSSGTYKVKSGDTLSAIAAKQSVSLSTLLKANGLSASSIIYPGQQLKLSNADSNSSSSSSASTSGTSAGSNSASSYKVKAGDTLSSIAARNGVSLSTILKANGLSLSSTIFPGQNIKLSGSAGNSSSSSSSANSSSSSGTSANSSYTVKAGDTLSGIASRSGVSLSTVLQANGLSSSSVIYPGQKLKLSGTASSSQSSNSSSSASSSATTAAATYTVKTGDTLSGIAARNGVSLQTLLNANGFSSSSIIYPGQSLKLKGSSSSNSSSVSTASSSNPDQLVGNTFLHYTYPDHVVADANANKQALLNAPMPSRNEVRQMIRDTASSMGVDPRLALAHAQIESGFDPAAVSPANAIGTMQVIPSSGEWASQLVGQKLNLLDPQDNITAGIAIIRHLQGNNPGDIGIASYYQGEAGVRQNGMYSDTKDYVAKINAAKSRY